MKIDIVNKRNYEPGEKLKEIIDRKVSKLERYFNDDTSIKVYLKKDNDICTMELALQFNGTYMRAVGVAETMYDAIDIVLPKLEKQIFRNKTKLQKKLKESAFKNKELIYSEQEAPGEDKQNVVKTKNFRLQPMDINEAILELDLLGHNFYVFLEKNSGTIQVVYRRDDGDYGVIVPEI